VATSILYLDVDDEITSAASRIRSAEARRVAIVLPYGSRVATSRINFRLLARDALTHEKRLSIVAGDAATRALAASAGLPVFSTVTEYEGSQEGDGPRPTGAASAEGADAGLAAGAAAATLAGAGLAATTGAATAAAVARPEVDTSAVTVEGTVPTPPVAPSRPLGSDTTTTRPSTATATAAADAAAPPIRSERVVRAPGLPVGRTPILVGLAVIALVVVVSGVAAYLLLPSATVAITPREESIGPVAFQVAADTEATAPDVEAGIVPATVITIPVESTSTFPATGQRVEEEPATGSVRFENRDFTSSNTIAKGAVVSTEAGVDFRTDKAVTVPRAELVGLTVVPSFANVAVTAVDAGPEGNVAQNTIQAEPRGEGPFLLVTNPEPTSGGTRTEFPRVTQEDVDAATESLRTGLTGAFNDQLADPDLSGGDLTVFPDTAVLGDPVWSEDPDDIVGREAESFDLGATAEGSVTAVDTAPVEAIAAERLAASVEAGYELVPESSSIEVADGVVSGGVVSFPVTVTARQIPILDPEAIEQEILGLPLVDAQAVLDRYGTATLVAWPDWVSAVPTNEGRVEVTVESAAPVETPSAAPSEEAP
jgi:hypothetical protein